MTNQGLDFLTSLTTFTIVLIGEGKKLNVKRKYLGHPNPVLCIRLLADNNNSANTRKMNLVEKSTCFQAKEKNHDSFNSFSD